MLVKRAVGAEWGWEAEVADDEFPEERGPAVIPFRLPPSSEAAASRALPTPKSFTWDSTGTLLRSATPAEPWPQRPVVKREEPVAAAPAPQPQPATFPRLTRAEATAAPVQEPFRAVLQRYADDHAGEHEPAAPPAPRPLAASKPPTPTPVPAQPREQPAAATKKKRPSADDAVERAFDVLTGIGLDDDIAEEALLEAVRVMPAEALTASERLIEVALARLVAALPKGPPLSAALGGCQLFFVGPAGAGKTTALLKTAVRLRDAGVDTGLVAADVSRIGAREQIERYGELLRLPVSIAYTPAELQQIIESAPPRRVLLIDTAASGPGPRTPQSLEMYAPDLAALMMAAPRRVPVLVLPAGAREGDLRRLANLARAAGACAATLTRLDDESDKPVPPDALPGAGLALNALARLHLPPLLCCTGRDVLSGHAAPSAMALAVAALESALVQPA
jgi:flagellar biosynthesis protein FlhF